MKNLKQAGIQRSYALYGTQYLFMRNGDKHKYQSGRGISKMVGPKKQAFSPRINMPPKKNL